LKYIEGDPQAQNDSATVGAMQNYSGLVENEQEEQGQHIHQFAFALYRGDYVSPMANSQVQLFVGDGAPEFQRQHRGQAPKVLAVMLRTLSFPVLRCVYS